MRHIPKEILEKIQKLHQTIYEDANPYMEVEIAPSEDLLGTEHSRKIPILEGSLRMDIGNPIASLNLVLPADYPGLSEEV